MNLFAADTSELDAPATQAHTGHTKAHRCVDGDGQQPPSHTGQAYEAPRPAGGPGTSGTAQPARSRRQLGELSLKACDPGELTGVQLNVHPEGASLDVVDPALDVGGGVGVVGVAHDIIKHHPVTDVNNISRHSLGTFADTCALFAGGIVSLHVGDNGARLVGVEG